MAKLQKISVTFPTKTGAEAEKAYAKLLDEFEAVQASIEGVLDEVTKTKPMPTKVETDLKARRQIAVGRNAELKDLNKARKSKELHTNPSKLQRIYKDLNEDIAQTNWLEGGVQLALDAHYEDGDVKELKKEIKAESPAAVKLAAYEKLLKDFLETNKKERWAKLDAHAKQLKADAAELERLEGVKALRDHADFKLLKQGSRDSIVNKAIKDSASTVKGTRDELVAALDTQDKPTKSRWAGFLGLGAGGSYTMKDGGSYSGYKIHVTMSNDSWTANADGKVSIKNNSADDLLTALLQSAPGLQLHATLEIGEVKQYPHIFLFAGVANQGSKWTTAMEAHKAAVEESKGKKVADKIDDTWITDGQAALTAVLDTLKQGLLTKLKQAKTTGGAGF